MADLKNSFIKAKYPSSMIDNIIAKVSSKERNLHEQIPEKELDGTIRVVTTFGSDSDIITSVKKALPHLSRTRSFSCSDGDSTVVLNPKRNLLDLMTDKPEKAPNKLFSFVKKTGSSLRNKLVRAKNLAVGQKYGTTVPCRHHGNCKTCELITDNESFTVNGKLVRTAPGTCTTYNIVYLVICKCCNMCYVGRTTRWLRSRMNEHRQNFYSILKPGTKIDPLDDNFSLGVHLTEHGFTSRTDFNENYRVCILSNCSPKVLEYQENKYIHILNTLRPNGLNVFNPFAMPIIDF